MPYSSTTPSLPARSMHMYWRPSQELDDSEGTEYQAEITTAHLVTGEYRRCVVYTVLAG